MIVNMERGAMSFKKDTQEFGVAQSGLMHIATEFYVAASLDGKNDTIGIQYLGCSGDFKSVSLVEI